MKAPDRVPIVLQQASSDCGVACLSSVISFFGGHQTLEQLRVLSGTAIQGTTVLGLIESAKSVGMDADAFRVDSVSRLDALVEPAILHVVMDEKFSHYIVCYGQVADGYLIMDPSEGKRILSAEILDRIWQSKSLVLAKPNSEFQLNSDFLAKKKKWIFDLVKPDLPILLISGFLGLIVTILGLSVAVFSQKLIDEILPKQQWEKLILGLVLLSILLVGRTVLGYLRSTVLIRQSKELNLRLISRFFEQLIYLPKRFFDSRKVGDITSRMNDSRRIQRAVSVLTTELMVDTFVVIVTLISILLYSEVIGLLVAGFLPVYFWLVYSYHHPIRLGQQQLMIHYGSSESSFIDTLTGIGAIKGAGREEDFLKKNQSVYHDFQDQAFRLGQVSNRLGLVSQLAGALFLVSVLGASSYLVATEQMDLGVLVAISGMLGMLVPAVNKLALSNLQIQEAKIALDRLYEFIQVEREPENPGENVPNRIDCIQLENISFRFPGRKLLLQNISFELMRGKLSVLLGESGGGKSTLLQLLMGFYLPEQGNIRVNGTLDLNSFSAGDWRRKVGYVPQEIKLFNGNLISNLTLNQDREQFAKAIKSCQTLGLSVFFESMPQGYFTVVGEEGINLSGGQKQLIGLARALIQEPKLLLLDEFTGAMDRNTEQMMLDLILKVKEAIPVLIVTHRVKPALVADEVLILENGKLVDFGSPEELLERENMLSESVRDLTK
jgi:ATP-binding cassette subfamily B protein